MATYIRFENNKQVETTNRTENPGEGWVKAPKSFNWDKRYILNDKGKVVEMSDEAIAQENLELLKPQKKAELIAQSDRFREAVYPVNSPKNDEYRIKTEAARRLVELEKNNQTISKTNPDFKLLKPEADVRGTTPIKLAKQIIANAEKTAIAVGVIAAYETKGKKMIKEAADAEALEKELDALTEDTAKQLNLNK
jgi:hypothetical protein